MWLIFDSLASAETALVTIDTNYGNDSNMLTWAIIKKAEGVDKWFFSKPEARSDKTVEDVMTGVISESEAETLPDEWFPAPEF